MAAAIAFLGVCIAWGQWHTTRQKLILDLFDKRTEKYRALRKATGNLNSQGMADHATRFAFSRAVYDMEYLFGRDVIDHLEETIRLLATIASAERRLQRMPDTERATAGVELTNELVDMDGRFHERMKHLHQLVLPYIRMEQRLPLTPVEWLKDRWETRHTGEE